MYKNVGRLLIFRFKGDAFLDMPCHERHFGGREIQYGWLFEAINLCNSKKGRRKEKGAVGGILFDRLLGGFAVAVTNVCCWICCLLCNLVAESLTILGRENKSC